MAETLEEKRKFMTEMRKTAAESNELPTTPLHVLSKSAAENVFKTVVLKAFKEELPAKFFKLNATEQMKFIAEKGKVTALTYFLNKSLIMNELLSKRLAETNVLNTELVGAVKKLENDIKNDVYARKCGELQVKITRLERQLEERKLGTVIVKP